MPKCFATLCHEIFFTVSSQLALNCNLRVSLIEPLTDSINSIRKVTGNRDSNQIILTTVSDSSNCPQLVACTSLSISCVYYNLSLS